MASAQDIRQWANKNGYTLGDRGAVTPEIRTAYTQATSAVEPEADEIRSAYTQPIESLNTPGERAPVVAKPRMAERLRSASDRVKTRVDKAAKSAPRTRSTLEKLIGRGWAMIGRIIQPMNDPMARVLAVQAPVAGMILDDLIKDTAIDKLLQPVARLEKKGEIAFALIAPPILVGLISARPDLAGYLLPWLKESLASWIDVAGPKLEEIQVREEKFQNEYGVKIDKLMEFFLASVTEVKDNDTSNVE